MICLVDIEHASTLEDPDLRSLHHNSYLETMYRLEDAAECACLIQRYPLVTRQRLAALGVRALVIGGNLADWRHYGPDGLAELQAIIREALLPILGICGGCQLIAMTYQANLGPMRPLADGETDVFPDFAPGYLKEVGFLPVHVDTPDPLLDRLGSRPVFAQIHYWEIKDLPVDFDVLASSDCCQVQIIKQRGRPVYGTQFHPERFDDAHPDGRQLLINFSRLAGVRS